MQRNLERMVVLFGGLLMVLLVVAAALAFRNTDQLDEDAAWVSQSHLVRGLTRDVMLSLVDAETAQRGFLITGDESFLAPYQAATSKLARRMHRLKDETRDHPKQRERVDTLLEMADNRMALVNEGIEARHRSWEEAQAFIAGKRGKQQMDAIRELVDDMDREEQRLLVEREAQRKRAYQFAIVSGLLTSSIALLLVGAISQVLLRNLKARSQAAAALHEQRELLRATLTSIGDCVIATDTSARITFLNPVAETLTGWPAQLALGQPLECVFRIINEETRRPVENPALRALEDGRIVGLANHSLLVDRAGNEHAIEDSAGPIQDAGGHISGAVLVFRDVSRERETARRLSERVALAEVETQVANALIRGGTLMAMLTHCTNLLAGHFPEASASVWVVNDVSRALEPMASADMSTQPPDGRARGPLGQLEIGMVAENRAPLLINDLAIPPDWNASEVVGKKAPLAFAGYPLLVDERLVGVLAVVARGPVSEPAQRSLGIIANLIGPAIERKRIEEHLVEARGRLDAALAAGRIGTFLWDILNDGLQWDAWKRELYALRADQVINSLDRFLELVHPDDRGKTKESFRRCAAEGAPLDVEFRIVGGDGVERWFISRGRTVLNADHVPSLLIGACVDITAQKQAQQAIRESERRLQVLADSIPHLAWMAKPGGGIFWFNQRWYDYTGTTIDEVQDWGWQCVIDPQERPRVLEKIKHSFVTAEPWEDIFSLRRFDGRFRWHLSRMLPVRDDRGHIVLWFGTNTDITEQREAAAALREADARKDEFLAMIGHELRNPLAGIVSGAHVLRMLPSSPEAAEMQDVIERQAAHMSRIVDDLLDVSRIARGKLSLRREALDLRDLVDKAICDYRNAHPLQDCDLSAVLPPHAVWISGDHTRLAQVVTNVVHNACKFCDGPNVVSVSLEADDAQRQARLIVTDRGIGMTKENLQRIFEPFHQADTTLDRSRGGLGLGLALVKGVIDLHGGHITAASEGLGRGTRIEIVLPIIEKPADSDGAAQALDTSTASRKVLLVDDRRDALLPLQRMLSMAGHQVVTATDGPSCLAQAKEFLPDVVLCDIGLAGSMSGYDVAQAARKIPELAHAYLVAITGYGQDEDRRRAQRVGFDFHVTKPVSREQLFDLVERMPRFDTHAP